MLSFPAAIKVYLCTVPCDMRRSFDGVTGHDLFPRGSQIIFQPLSQIPFRPDRPTVATGRATAG